MATKTIDLKQSGIRLYESKHTEGEFVKEHHHHFFQILYALEGNGTITLDGKSYPFAQDRCAVIVPFSNHSILSETKLTVLVLAFEKHLLDTSMQDDLLESCFQKSTIISMQQFSGSELRQLLRKMLFEQSHDQLLNYLAMKIHLSEILLVLARGQQNENVTDANSLRAARIRSYIDTHYFEIVNANDISGKIGISNRHLNNIFKEKYQITPIQYLTEVRIELAKKMLTGSDKDIISIGFEVGFETISTFYRSFKNVTKMSPNKYRQLHKV